LVSAAGEFGWPVVTLSRPGYATSSRQVGRCVADAAKDVSEVLDHLGAGRFVTAGWSGS
jgi:pimeloyl-ACP methyl ester carboxylesterase